MDSEAPRTDGECNVCGSPFGEQPVTSCPVCDTRHHTDCWLYNGGCSVFGCAGRADGSARVSVSALAQSGVIPVPAPVGPDLVRVAVWIAAALGCITLAALAGRLYRVDPMGEETSGYLRFHDFSSDDRPAPDPGPTRAATESPPAPPAPSPVPRPVTPLTARWTTGVPGRIVWSATGWPGPGAGPLVFAATAVPPARGAAVVALDDATGRILWRRPYETLSGKGDLAVVLLPTRVAVTTLDAIEILDRKTGQSLAVRKHAARLPQVEIARVEPAGAIVGGPGRVFEIGDRDRYDPIRRQVTRDDAPRVADVPLTETALPEKCEIVGAGARHVLLLQRNPWIYKLMLLPTGRVLWQTECRLRESAPSLIRLSCVVTAGQELQVRSLNDGSLQALRRFAGRIVRIEERRLVLYLMEEGGGFSIYNPLVDEPLFWKGFVLDFQVRDGDVLVLLADGLLERLSADKGETLARYRPPVAGAHLAVAGQTIVVAPDGPGPGTSLQGLSLPDVTQR